MFYLVQKLKARVFSLENYFYPLKPQRSTAYSTDEYRDLVKILFSFYLSNSARLKSGPGL